MYYTLFRIPPELFGLPLFGPTGMATLLWLVVALAVTAFNARKQGLDSEVVSNAVLMIAFAGVLALVVPWMMDPEGIPIRGFGMLVLTGIVSGVAVARWQAKRMGLDPELIFQLTFWLFVGGFAGARAFYVIEYWDQFQRDSLVATLRAVANIAQGGIVVYGAAMGGALVFALFARKHQISIRALGDLVAPSLMIGLAFGRLGCLLNGCCFGGTCDLPWAVTFPVGSPPFERQLSRDQIKLDELEAYGFSLGANRDRPLIREVAPDSPAAAAGLTAGQRITAVAGVEVGTAEHVRLLLGDKRPYDPVVLSTADREEPIRWTLPSTGQRSLPVHPTQVYSSITAALLAAFLLAWYPYRTRDGEVLALLFTLYPLARFLLEEIRVDEPGVWGTTLSVSQMVSLGVLLVVALFWVYLLKQPPGSVLPITAEQSGGTQHEARPKHGSAKVASKSGA